MQIYLKYDLLFKDIKLNNMTAIFNNNDNLMLWVNDKIRANYITIKSIQIK